MYLFWDPTYIILIPAMLISMYAQMKVSSAYSHYSQVKAKKPYTGYDVAKTILQRNGLNNIKIETVRGQLTDHYDPRAGVLRLSQGVYGGNDVAAFGIAAHEVGHAIQHAKKYAPLELRNAIVPVANIGTKLSWVFILLGLFILGPTFVKIGIFLFAGFVIFQLITLPVEFDASKRAVAELESAGLVYMDEVPQVKKVLSAAAMTYVAATIAAVSQLLRLLVLFGGQRRRD